jgi:antirestriction protein
MTTLYAQPYDLAASGFYFDSEKAYASQASRLRNAYGQPVEEFEIQFIDGEGLDGKLFDALHVSQATIGSYFEAAEEWDDDQKLKVIIAVGEAGYSFALGNDDPDKFDIDLYEIDSLRDLAVQFIDEGLFGEIPKAIENYLDYDAIARDLAMDYGTVTIDGTHYAYRCD